MSKSISTSVHVVQIEAGEGHEARLDAPLFCPYHNRWGESAYSLGGAFEHCPLQIHASSTSGAPVVEDASGRFVGILDFSWVQAPDVVFRYDGSVLTVLNQSDRVLEVAFSETPRRGGGHWRDYNRLLADRLPVRENEPTFWSDLEYCTWVEQKHVALQAGKGCSPHDVIDDAFLDRYMDDIDRLGLPKGKLTIDHGWQHGDETYGDWDPHPDRFTDLGRTAERITAAGFTPRIWLAPIWLHPASRVARADPSLLGEPIAPSNADSPNIGDWNYWRPGPELAERVQQIFGDLYEAGYRKFKLDMVYGRKDLMAELQSVIYPAIKAVAPDAEVETHHPDPFLAIHTDTVRTNDILCNPRQGWRRLTQEHFEVCHKSAFGRVINLDHVGGNDPAVTPADFLEHLSLYRDAVGYPVISMLPHHVSDEAVEAVRNLLEAYRSDPRPRSRFISPGG